jgi:prepilin-type N-terminal cleavage/methylation domain-containing protein
MNIKNMKNEKGFTIVELLIVIVVIGILAAITIVAYNGVQARAKLSAASDAASKVAAKAEAYNAEKAVYPPSIASLTTSATSTDSFQVTGITIQATAIGSAPTNPNTVNILNCTNGGTIVQFWDYTKNALSGSATPAGVVANDTAGNATGTCTLLTS